ncbi:hypothetical protein I3760_16G000500 [Carya illinoinensis]|uniref:Armadillo-like repeats domain-containing protein n=2 Tax=Carya illinoinensis TaxID=32201 RepID=A0A8T1N192_CARIL|nr:uncharacterized protein LOC122299097 isoform X1 [Carya illinoinensis]KAG2662829.1 hypothetical protein I3760_16G000500 [Carya illinoinensis]KAG6624069.1 hypothetical protein CIPAW_16G000600 [Carya illinoinensis]KAG6671357.1 hypothetical protein I3842_16G000400 [Carya illinoinensis]
MAMAAAACTCSYASQLLPRSKFSTLTFPSSSVSCTAPSVIQIPCLRTIRRNPSTRLAAAKKDLNAVPQEQGKQQKKAQVVEEEEDLPWIQDKALDLVEFTGSVAQAIPGPRVGSSSLPWILALPLAYAGLTFVIAFVKTVRKFTSPREKRRRLVNKNVMLCKSIDEVFLEGRDNETLDDALKRLEKKTGFGMEEILRKYIRYALNEKPFNPDLISNLIELRKASMLDDSQVTEILNEISRRIVRDKGPVVLDMSGYSEKGFKRKLAVQALFGKVFYLSELPEFCSRDSSLVVKEIFGVTDEDADKLRIHTLSEAGDMDSLEKMVDGSDSEDSSG